MPMPGKGMLLTSMDIDPAHEAEFNRWYDREHLAERVAIEGFIEARRYVAHEAKPKYLSLYSTETFDVLDSPAYRTALGAQTDWSKANIARFHNMIRSVARITISRGQGRGAALGMVRIRPGAGQADALRARLRDLRAREVLGQRTGVRAAASRSAAARAVSPRRRSTVPVAEPSKPNRLSARSTVPPTTTGTLIVLTS